MFHANRAPYRTNPEETKEIERQVQELLDKGYVRESLSPCAVLVILGCVGEDVGPAISCVGDVGPAIGYVGEDVGEDVSLVLMSSSTCHLGVPSSASKLISEHMVCSMQIVHLSCIKISTISKQTEPNLHLSLFT